MSRLSVRNFSAGAGKPVSVKPDSLAGVRPARGWLRSAGGGSAGDERGITLQTLIITAVLVLLAVAAGVVIAAITGNSADDLEDQASDIEGRCLPWEIHDTQLAAAGLGGYGDTTPYVSVYGYLVPFGFLTPDKISSWHSRGKVMSSRLGCLAPCYLKSTITTSGSILDNFAHSGEYDDWEVELVFDTSNRPPKHKLNDKGEVVEAEYRLGVEYLRETEEHFKEEERRSDGSSTRRRANYESGMFAGETTVFRTQSLDENGAPPVFVEGGFALASRLNHPSNAYNDEDYERFGLRNKSAVRVNDQKDGCVIYNTANDVICIDSTKPDGQQYTDCDIF